MKFSQMPYVRHEFEETNAKFATLLKKLKEAASADECFAVFKEFDKYCEQAGSMFIIARIRRALDTAGKFYDAENDYAGEVEPWMEEVLQEFTRAILDSPFRKEMKAYWIDDSPQCGNVAQAQADGETKRGAGSKSASTMRRLAGFFGARLDKPIRSQGAQAQRRLAEIHRLETTRRLAEAQREYSNRLLRLYMYAQ